MTTVGLSEGAGEGLTVREAGERLACDANTVRRWADQGRLRWLEGAHPRRVRRAEVEHERAALLERFGVGIHMSVGDAGEPGHEACRVEIETLRRRLEQARETARPAEPARTVSNIRSSL